MIFLLTVTYASGRVSVLTFDSVFDRGLVMIGLAEQPVTLQTAEYAR